MYKCSPKIQYSLIGHICLHLYIVHCHHTSYHPEASMWSNSRQRFKRHNYFSEISIMLSPLTFYKSVLIIALLLHWSVLIFINTKQTRLHNSDLLFQSKTNSITYPLETCSEAQKPPISAENNLNCIKRMLCSRLDNVSSVGSLS